MVSLEIPVVTTALVSIVGGLGGFDKISWVVSSYLLGYVGKQESVNSFFCVSLVFFSPSGTKFCPDNL